MKFFTTTLLLIFTISFGFAQNSIKGKIVDTQNESLPYANVILYKIGEESNPKGTVSDENGNYRFENISSANYKIEVSMLGFETKKINQFLLLSLIHI